MKAQTIVKKYPKGLNGSLKRKMAEIGLSRKGYVVQCEEEVKEYSGGKGLLLGLIFLPLALLGGKKYVKVTYQLI